MALLACAYCLQFASFSNAGKFVVQFTKFMQLPEGPEKEQIKATAHSYGNASRFFALFACTIAVLTAVPFYLSIKAEESAPRSIIYILAAFFVLFQFVAI